ncbi:uncharacterized protein LOC112557377 isoform X2 [Pomacea canaliculata]|uniref:uncharacterized protein LOC112557377 isoform X2 n=1 Tax=Pomacea canaliculata TaxID=400727 RepID=UPI000D732D7B|nr:uncharacterized protein LOC112557377 isoform X2 [Pomacea canaliculata]
MLAAAVEFCVVNELLLMNQMVGKPGKAEILEMANFSPDQTKHRYLIYTCRLTQYCGGLSDRLRGIAYAFLLAVITRRRFGVHMELPTCELSSMLEVNHLDWRVNITSLDESNLTSQVYNRVNNVSIRKEFMTIDFNTYFDKDIVYYTSNQILFRELFANPHHLADLGWLTKVPQGEIFRQILNTLFKLAPSLQSEVDNITDQAHRRHGGGMLVAAQLRCGRNPSIPKDTQVRLVPEDLQVIWKFLKSYLANPAASFFIASDSEEVVREAKSKFRERLLESSGPIVHVAYSKNSDDVCSGMRRVLVDIHVLAASDVLLVTRSGIGDLASHLRGFDKGGLYCFRPHDARVTALNITVNWLCR